MLSAEFAIILWSVLEIVLALVVWHRQLLQIILIVPLVLLGVTVFSSWYGFDCGCFGSLPLLNRFSFGAHLLLLVGMFLGLYYLTTSTTKNIAETQDNAGKMPKTPRSTGLAALAMMVLAFLSLPFTISSSRAAYSADNSLVDRTATETVIANRSAVLIDARPSYQYVMGHLPGAINIPYDSENLVELVDKHSLKKQPVIVYCSSARCNAAELLAKKLHILGCNKISIYPGGWEDWVLNH
ncbi:MAG: rhodanese-like domain-containing protein [candidate division KSB1 bacterium]|nr:rhodanese-like domain-containing protein [candidate division KSB1 bacterium]